MTMPAPPNEVDQQAMPHEVIFLRPLHGQTKRELAIQCLMVEFGFDFAFDGQQELPTELPQDVTGAKLVLIDQKSWNDYHNGESGKRLRALAASGTVVACIDGPERFDAIDEQQIRGNLEMFAASAGLTPGHRRLRSRLQARSFSEIYLSLREPYFLNQLRSGLSDGYDKAFNEPYSYNILQTALLLDEYDPEYGWQSLLEQHIDGMMALPEGEFDSLDRISGQDVFVQAGQLTGKQRYIDFAESMLRRVASNWPQIEGIPVLKPDRDQILWNESVAHFAPAAAAVGIVCDVPQLTDLAVHTAHTLHKLNYDASKQLWYHWGARGRRGPAIWARGQAWALTGLVGILRHLPESHPEQPCLVNYILEIIQGLKATQTREGLWHNVLDDTTSRIACRASAMFVYSLAEAQQRKWISPESVSVMLARAWQGLRGRLWRDRICTCCCGTGAGASYQFYLGRPHLFNGASSILRAGVTYVQTYGEHSADSQPEPVGGAVQ